MSIELFIEQLEALAQEADKAFSEAADSDQLDLARVEFLGAKKGRLECAYRTCSPARRKTARATARQQGANTSRHQLTNCSLC